MRAGLIGVVVFSGAAVAALAWTQFGRVPHDPPPQPVASAGRGDGLAGISDGSSSQPSRDRAPAPAPGGPRPPADEIGATGRDAGARPVAPVEEDRLAAIASDETASVDLQSAKGSAPAFLAPPAPRFDIVRVDAAGQTVIAGRSGPNERVEVLLDGTVVDTMLADASGRFATVLDAGPSASARELRLRVAMPDAPGPLMGGPGTKTSDRTAPGLAPQMLPPGEKLIAGGAARQDGTPTAPRPAQPPAPAGTSEAAPRAGGGTHAISPPQPPAGAATATRPDNKRSVAGTSSVRASAPEFAATDLAMTDAGATDAAATDAADGKPAAAALETAAENTGLPRRPSAGADGYLLSDPVIILPAERAGSAPALVQARDGQLALLQPGGPATDGVVLDQLTQAPDGDLLLRGRARPQHVVRIYGNGKLIETVPVADGSWTLPLSGRRADGIRLFRLDEVGRSGSVISRVEVPFDASGAASQVVRDRSITVRRGDNLWRIAEKHYGDGIRYSLIFGANSDLIRDPDLIYPDQVFTVPELVDAE